MTIGKCYVELCQESVEMEGFLKRRHMVLSDSGIQREELRLKGGKVKYDPLEFFRTRIGMMSNRSLGKEEKQMARKGLHTSVDKDDSERFSEGSPKVVRPLSKTATGKGVSIPFTGFPRLDADFLVVDSKFMKVAFGVSFKMIAVPSSGIVTTSMYVVPTGRVKVRAGRYVVPTGKDNVIVSTGKTIVIPASSTILVLVV
ncbi:hypothetical protein Tco_0631107 [Tanacetum coccineum]